MAALDIILEHREAIIHTLAHGDAGVALPPINVPEGRSMYCDQIDERARELLAETLSKQKQPRVLQLTAPKTHSIGDTELAFAAESAETRQSVAGLNPSSGSKESANASGDELWTLGSRAGQAALPLSPLQDPTAPIYTLPRQRNHSLDQRLLRQHLLAMSHLTQIRRPQTQAPLHRLHRTIRIRLNLRLTPTSLHRSTTTDASPTYPMRMESSSRRTRSRQLSGR